jgi:hypothetical protein
MSTDVFTCDVPELAIPYLFEMAQLKFAPFLAGISYSKSNGVAHVTFRVTPGPVHFRLLY